MDIYAIQQPDVSIQFNQDHIQPERRKRWCGLCIVLVLVFGGGFVTSAIILNDKDKGTFHPDPDGPRQDGLQMRVQASRDNNRTWTSRTEKVPEDLDYLEGLGLKFFLSASNSPCPPEVCRKCTTDVYKDSPQHIEPEGNCNGGKKTINASCWLCEYRGGSECYSFVDALSGRCRGYQPSCAELTKMADLNNFCNGGYAIFDLNMRHETLDKQLKCVCPHGQVGDRCENEADKEKVLCSCYNKRFKIQETQPEFRVGRCENVPYYNNTKCLYSVKKENCYCISTEDSDILNMTTNCDNNNSDDSANDDSTSDDSTSDDSPSDDTIDRKTRDSDDPNMGRQTNNGNYIIS